MDQLAAYRAFVLVADHGGFSAAARAAGQSQSAISRQVADLEGHFDTLLFERTTRRVALTPDGERVLGTARGILALALEAERAVGSQASAAHCRLRIAAPASLGHVLLAPHICTFQARHPQFDIETQTLSASEAGHPHGKDVDLIIELGPQPARLGERRKLGDVPMVLCAAPGFVRKYGAPKTIDDAAKLPAVHVLPIGEPLRAWRLERGAEHREITPPAHLRCDSPEVARAAALESAGIALVPLWLVSRSIASGRLWRLLPQWHGGLVPIYAGPPGRIPPPAHVRDFLDFLAASLERDGIFA